MICIILIYNTYLHIIYIYILNLFIRHHPIAVGLGVFNFTEIKAQNEKENLGLSFSSDKAYRLLGTPIFLKYTKNSLK